MAVLPSMRQKMPLAERNQMKLKDRVVIVTGGGRGIGRAIAIAFAAEGAKVAAAARTFDEIRSTVDEIKASGGVGLAVKADVSKEGDVAKMVARVERTFGPVDILVNNAGVALFKPLLETTAQDWDRLAAVNAKGAFLCCKAALPSMLKRKAGRIINVSSTAGQKGYPEQSAYCASKHAMIGFSKVLAIETHGTGVRVNVICPGGVDTRLVWDGRDDVDLSKYMQPEEIAEVALFLVTQERIAAIDEVIVRRDGARAWLG